MTSCLWVVYVLFSERTRSLYVGCTNNIKKRLAAHNSGKGAKYTRGRGPWVVRALKCGFETRGQALSYEAYLKSISRKDKIEWCEEHPYNEQEELCTTTKHSDE